MTVSVICEWLIEYRWSSDVLRDHAARLTNAEPNEPASGFLASTSAYLMLDTVPVSSAQVL